MGTGGRTRRFREVHKPRERSPSTVTPDTFRQIEGDYALRADATVQLGIRCPSGLVVGPRAEVQGDIEAHGFVHLAKAAVVHGSIRAGLDVVVGARALVGGDITAGGNVHILKEAKVRGEVHARGDLHARERSEAALLHADGDVRIAGPVDVGGIEAGGRTAFVQDAAP